MPHVPSETSSKKETPHTFAPYNIRSVEVDPPTFQEKDKFENAESPTNTLEQTKDADNDRKSSEGIPDNSLLDKLADSGKEDSSEEDKVE